MVSESVFHDLWVARIGERPTRSGLGYRSDAGRGWGAVCIQMKGKNLQIGSSQATENKGDVRGTRTLAWEMEKVRGVVKGPRGDRAYTVARNGAETRPKL